MSILFLILQLIPTILASVQSIEVALPMQGAGKAKLDLVLGTVGDVYDTSQTLQKEIGKDDLFKAVSATIARVVATFNALGVFNKKK